MISHTQVMSSGSSVQWRLPHLVPHPLSLGASPGSVLGGQDTQSLGHDWLGTEGVEVRNTLNIISCNVYLMNIYVNYLECHHYEMSNN